MAQIEQAQAIDATIPWYRTLNLEQWRVLVASNLGWLFDGFEISAIFLTVGFALRQLLDPSQYSAISLIMGLAGSLAAFLAGGTFAQAQQTSPAILSNRLGDATATEISVTAKPGQGPGIQVVFNAASLPPIGSIGAESNIRPFLQPGVPQELTRAALRRAWVTDPAIRDFTGLAENSWDFNSPDGASRFGSLTALTGEALRAGSSAQVK